MKTVNRSIVSSAIYVEEDLSATNFLKSVSTSIFVSKVMNVRRLLKTAKISIHFSDRRNYQILKDQMIEMTNTFQIVIVINV
jgi:hypothetical protein